MREKESSIFAKTEESEVRVLNLELSRFCPVWSKYELGLTFGPLAIESAYSHSRIIIRVRPGLKRSVP